MTLILTEKMYGEIWSKIKDFIRSTGKKSGSHDKKYMEIRDNSDDDLPLNEALTLYGIVKLLDQFSKEDTKYYSQLFLS